MSTCRIAYAKYIIEHWHRRTAWKVLKGVGHIGATSGPQAQWGDAVLEGSAASVFLQRFSALPGVPQGHSKRATDVDMQLSRTCILCSQGQWTECTRASLPKPQLLSVILPSLLPFKDIGACRCRAILTSEVQPRRHFAVSPCLLD
jgi:hypothetical protein